MPNRLLGAGLAVLLLIGCTTTDPTPSGDPTADPGIPSATPELTLIPTDPGTTPAPTPPGQTDTAWGRIWDGLPTGFPAFPGTKRTETGEGPASAILDAGAADPAEVASFYESALEGARYSTVSLAGPREDGSWEVESASDGGCGIQVTVTPRGSSTILTVLYGAACPFS